jgi:hypothetical protein
MSQIKQFSNVVAHILGKDIDDEVVAIAEEVMARASTMEFSSFDDPKFIEIVKQTAKVTTVRNWRVNFSLVVGLTHKEYTSVKKVTVSTMEKAMLQAQLDSEVPPPFIQFVSIDKKQHHLQTILISGVEYEPLRRSRKGTDEILSYG